MNVAGHLAFAFLSTEPLHARTRGRLSSPRDRDLTLDAFVLLGALVPDLIDKPLRLIGFTPHGRSIGHALLVWLLFTCLAILATTLIPRARSLSLIAYGWATHFVADTLDDLVAGLLETSYLWTSWAGWPWLTADAHKWMVTAAYPTATSWGFEAAVVAMATIVSYRAGWFR